MILTREKLIEKCKPRFEWVEVEGFGKVGIREPLELQRSRRVSRMFDRAGNHIEASKEMRRMHMIIDQLMVDEAAPMFAAGDKDAMEILSQLSSTQLDPIVAAIVKFNGDDEKKDEAGSDDGEAS